MIHVISLAVISEDESIENMAKHIIDGVIEQVTACKLRGISNVSCYTGLLIRMHY